MSDAIKVTAGASVGLFGKVNLPTGTWSATFNCKDNSGRTYPFSVTLSNPTTSASGFFQWDIALEAASSVTRLWAGIDEKTKQAEAWLKFTDSSNPPVIFYRGPFIVEIKGAPF